MKQSSKSFISKYESATIYIRKLVIAFFNARVSVISSSRGSSNSSISSSSSSIAAEVVVASVVATACNNVKTIA